MISCIIGSKDRLTKLKKLMPSLYSNYKSIGAEPDIIVIDGGSRADVIRYLVSCPGVTLLREGMLHGVTRAYNRGFRLAKYPYVTWFSDDVELTPNLFKLAVENFKQLGANDVLSISMNNNDGQGWHVYRDITPVGFCTKKLMTRVDFWSEDYITYASDLDFCLKAMSAGGKMQKNPELRINHYMNSADELHKQNSSANADTNRYRKVWGIVTPGRDTDHISKRVYPNVFVNAQNKSELIHKVQRVWREISWCNIYVEDYQGLDYLASMNVIANPGMKDSCTVVL